MIPPTLAAFRALMERAATVVGRNALSAADTEYSSQLNALATATPEQLLGIVGAVERMKHVFIPGDTHIAGYYVTPREEP